VPEIVARAPGIRIVVLTGYGSIASTVEALHRGAHHYLSKPADADEIIAALEGAEAASGPKHPVAQQAETPTLARAEWEHMSRILADCGGNVSEAARRLGITRRALQLKLKKHPPVR
jgi:two-component system response regulator RegA